MVVQSGLCSLSQAIRAGEEAVKWLLSKLSHDILLKFINESGMFPHSWLLDRTRSIKLKFPSSAGIEPLS
ncbi:hypothetical protein THIOM_003570 [Candidatus Thiomargarita nelsonii]|uniref:Uncharacterized protein n=1 Tax=Candidatus Thiomargarita nelsonii TaxID=1003181 RepID=A0A176RYD3_9GAMM|nr:hypothetical protein THIOM_003570 [Candidatus Thiomargarita nelsonii]